IRDRTVTGVQTCALPILFHERLPASPVSLAMRLAGGVTAVAAPVILTVVSERRASRLVTDVSRDVASSAASVPAVHEPRREERQIGRASCRERAESTVDA